jgi:VWFA-related protein
MSRIQLASLLLVFLLASPTEASRLGNGSKAIGGYGKDFAVVVPSQRLFSRVPSASEADPLAAIAQAAGGTVQVTQVDPSRFPEVSLYVSVADASGQVVGGLTQDDFQVFEDGKQALITDFAGTDERRSVDIVFAFDTTSSMEEQIEGVKRICVDFANRLREHHRDFRLGLVAFGDEIRGVYNADGSLTGDAEEFKSWISQLWADGGDDTPEISLDAVQRAAEMSYRPGTQKVIILITDAPPHVRDDGTPFSRITLDELLARLRDQGFTVYAVAYNDDPFHRLAAETHGEFYDIDVEPDFTGIIHQIGGIIAAQYRLTYRSARPFHDGTWRNITVEVKGRAGKSSYLEAHLLSIRSNAAIGLLFLLPLLAALVLPTVWRSLARPRPLAPALAHDMDRPLPAAAPSMEPKPSLPLAAATDQASCIRCGRPLRPDARFCSGCGAPVAAAPAPPSSIACPQCGRLARPGTKFCGGCGRKLT